MLQNSLDYYKLMKLLLTMKTEKQHKDGRLLIKQSHLCIGDA